jgi:thiol:disulfide interchange protein
MAHKLRSSFPVLCLFSACAFLAAVTLISCAKEKRETRAEGAGLEWLTSMDAAMEAARHENRPVMIDFYTDWCAWCKRLDADTYADKQVIAAAGDFVAVKINADVERALAAKYKVTGFPTILFTDAAGNEIHRVVGYRPPQGFLAEMNGALQASKR